jgi:hypothetical protein
VRAGAFLIIAGLLAARANAADPQPICTDRPGKSTETCTVPSGRFQVESDLADWTLRKGGSERETLLSIGETTFKYGLTDHSDIELDVIPWQRTTRRANGAHESASGFGDLSLIYKHMLTPRDATLQVTAYPFVKIPTAKRPIGNRKWEGGFVLPILYNIPKSPLSINLSPEVDWILDGDGHGRHAAMAQVVSLGWQVTPKLSLSGEIWSQWDWDPAGTKKQASLDASAAYLVSNDVQLDVGANFGLNRATPDVQMYVGISEQF